MSKTQGTGVESKPAASAASGGGGGGETDIATLTNALRFEREKNEVLLNEVVALEDELVNRQLSEFESVISDATRDFWREQLLSNREAAQGALSELARLKDEGVKPSPEGGGEPETRRPLHNRQTARPQLRQGFVGQAAKNDAGGDSTAVKIRNRAHELSKTERIPFSTAFRRAEREVSG